MTVEEGAVMAVSHGGNVPRNAMRLFFTLAVVALWALNWIGISISAGGFLPPLFALALAAFSIAATFAVAVVMLLFLGVFEALLLAAFLIGCHAAAVLVGFPDEFAFAITGGWWTITILPALVAADSSGIIRPSEPLHRCAKALSLGRMSFWVLLLTSGALVYHITNRSYTAANAPRVEPSKDWIDGIDTVDAFRAASMDVNSHDENGVTLLHYAAANADAAFVEFLIREGANVDAQQWWGNTPIFSAIGSLRKKDASGKPIRDSIAPQAEATVEALVAAGASATIHGSHGDTPLHAAASDGTWRIAEILLDAGADIEARNEYGSTPLHDATGWRGRDVAIAELLLERGANVDARNLKEATPLRQAAFTGSPEAVRVLVDAGADVNARDRDGKVPLHGAAQPVDGHEKIAVLAAAGADPNLFDNKGCAPLHIAAAWTGRIQLVEALLAAGADPNLRTSGNGWTALDILVGEEEAFHRPPIEALLRSVTDTSVKPPPGMPKDLCSPYRD